MKGGIIILLALLMLPAAIALDISVITEDGWQPPIHYSISQNDKVILTGASETKNFSVELEDGQYEISTWLEKEQLPYLAGLSTIYISEATSEVTTYLSPVGTLSLTFKSKDGIAIENPFVRIDCGNAEYYRGDEFGSLTTTLPARTCIIQAAYKDATQTQEIEVVQGQLITQTIVLDIKLSKLGPWLTFVGILIIIVAILIIYKASRLQGKIKPAEDSLHNLELLAKKEKTVVNFLIEKIEAYKGKPSSFYVNQSAIIHEAGIPKTSLARILTSLEGKKLITVEKVGKAKRIYLNPNNLKKQ